MSTKAGAGIAADPTLAGNMATTNANKAKTSVLLFIRSPLSQPAPFRPSRFRLERLTIHSYPAGE
jgi:hypothetical protein